MENVDDLTIIVKIPHDGFLMVIIVALHLLLPPVVVLSLVFNG
jgi:hypothetical protein